MVVLRWLANAYVWVFVPFRLLVQLIFWFNLGLVIPRSDSSRGRPSGSDLDNDVISGIVAAILGLTLHEAAVIAEIYRGGMAGVSPGQHEAGLAVGLTPRGDQPADHLPARCSLSRPGSWQHLHRTGQSHGAGLGDRCRRLLTNTQRSTPRISRSSLS